MTTKRIWNKELAISILQMIICPIVLAQKNKKREKTCWFMVFFFILPPKKGEKEQYLRITVRSYSRNGLQPKSWSSLSALHAHFCDINPPNQPKHLKSMQGELGKNREWKHCSIPRNREKIHYRSPNSSFPQCELLGLRKTFKKLLFLVNTASLPLSLEPSFFIVIIVSSLSCSCVFTFASYFSCLFSEKSHIFEPCSTVASK